VIGQIAIIPRKYDNLHIPIIATALSECGVVKVPWHWWHLVALQSTPVKQCGH